MRGAREPKIPTIALSRPPVCSIPAATVSEVWFRFLSFVKEKEREGFVRGTREEERRKKNVASAKLLKKITTHIERRQSKLLCWKSRQQIV